MTPPPLDEPEMADEFDLVPRWTADVVVDLGPDHAVPAGCRGSGSPAGLSWLLERLAPARGAWLADVGAGVGGPAAFAADRTGVRPLLLEPAGGACRAARRLFPHPVAQASATALPLSDATAQSAWSLGVLCTLPAADQGAALAEAARVLADDGRLALLVFVAARPELPFQPAGNTFPDADTLARHLDAAGFDVDHRTTGDALPDAPADWTRRADAVERALEERHGDDERWQTAQHQSELIGRLIGGGDVVPTYLTARRRPR